MTLVNGIDMSCSAFQPTSAEFCRWRLRLKMKEPRVWGYGSERERRKMKLQWYLERQLRG